jgi:hypothetical protein
MHTLSLFLLMTALNTVLSGSISIAQDRISSPAPHGPIPSERQQRWHEMEFHGFLHFSINTFTDKERGYGDESPAFFNPSDFDADEITRLAKEVGMKGLILTAKHHDGFCLWPSRYTEHSVKNSPWKGGKGDVVKEMSVACRRYELKHGVFFSPWYRNYKDYGKPRPWLNHHGLNNASLPWPNSLQKIPCLKKIFRQLEFSRSCNSISTPRSTKLEIWSFSMKSSNVRGH